MLQAIKNCWNKDHYRRAALVTLPVSVGFLFYLIATAGFIIPEWVLYLLLPASFIGTFLSGATYLARPFDHDSPLIEKISTVIFAGLGILITELICHATNGIPFFGSIGKLAYAVFGLANISNFAGLGNRLGNCTNENTPINERRSKGVGAIIGAGLGATLCLCAKTALITSAAAFIPGAAFILPAVLAATVVSTSISSTTASASDYISKGYNYVKYASGYSKDSVLNARIQKQYHEYRGSAIGVGIGIGIGLVAAVLMPHVVTGIVAVGIGYLAVTACCSIIGGLCSRIGRLMDGFKQPAAENKAQQTPAIPAKSSAMTQTAQNQTALGFAVKPGIQSKMLQNNTASDAKKIMSLLQVVTKDANTAVNQDNVNQNTASFKSPLNNMSTAVLQTLDNSRNVAVKNYTLSIT